MVRFTTPPNQDDFREAVWEMVERIPRGRVCAYGRIAELVGPPAGMDFRAFKAFGARWVGGAMAHCPEGVPWWRVINAQGKISAREGAGRQRKLLEDEGVPFSPRGRVDLDAFGWPDES
jgi:methylated-DNA-protein-cysteine methyltransferase related protein